MRYVLSQTIHAAYSAVLLCADACVLLLFVLPEEPDGVDVGAGAAVGVGAGVFAGALEPQAVKNRMRIRIIDKSVVLFILSVNILFSQCFDIVAL